MATRPTRMGLTAGLALLLLDAALAALAWVPVASFALLGPEADWLARLAIPLLPPACYLLFLCALGLHRRDALVETRKSLARAPLAALLGALTAAMLLRLAPLPGAPSPSVLLGVGVLCFTIAGFAARVVHADLCHRNVFRRRLLVIGAGKRAWDLAYLLRREGRTLAYEVTFLHDPATGKVDPRLAEDPSCRILTPPPSNSTPDYLAIAHDVCPDRIVVAPDDRRGLAMMSLLACKTAGYPVQEYLTFLEAEIGRVDVKRLELGWLIYAEGFTFSPLDRALKRLLDIAVSLAVLLPALPFLLAAALAVKLEDGGPVLYSQARVTQGGRVFRIYKLRTMRMDAERLGATWAAERDPRITRVGHFLRRTRLDELPQLFNVLRGDMSLVGPRPERPEFTAKLAAELPLYEERHLVKAGLTGWAQINYPYGASLDDARSKLSYDLHYVKNYGILLDLLILLQTVRVVLWPGGVR